MKRILTDMRIKTVLLIAVACMIFAAAPSRASDLALVNAKIYVSPTEPAIENGSILIHDGRIVAVGPKTTVKIPAQSTILDCTGLVVGAGFWNSHVHILLPGLLHAEKLSASQIEPQLQQMFTRWGFTTVFDVASVLQNTNEIRRRIESGEIRGPRIFTVGEPFWIKGGTPIYVKYFLEANHISMPEIESPAQAKTRVREQTASGADGIKIFANSVEQNGILTMPLDVAQAAVSETHQAHKPVFAHVSNNQGIEVSLRSGVDILTHTTPYDSPWDSAFAHRLSEAHLALTPTLTLWEVEGQKGGMSAKDIDTAMTNAAHQLQAFSQAGGQVLFGTDVGYTDRFDTSEEFLWMSRAGLDFRQILASLTTNPANRFGYSSHSGKVASGMDADLVVLSGDPAQDPTAFSKVLYTIRNGILLYSGK